MGTNCAPLVADLFLFCYDGDFMTSPSNEIKPILLRHLTQTLLLNIDNSYVEGMVIFFYPPEL